MLPKADPEMQIPLAKPLSFTKYDVTIYTVGGKLVKIQKLIIARKIMAIALATSYLSPAPVPTRKP